MTRRRSVGALDSGGSVHQSVALVVALMLGMMMAPAAAGAAGTLVSIVDPSTGVKAHVTDGKLQIGDGSGPLTVNGNVDVANLPAVQPVAGVVDVAQKQGAAPLTITGNVKAALTLNGSHRLPVNVEGTITDQQGIPADPWNSFITGNNQATLTLFAPPAAATDLAVTSLTVMNTGDVAGTLTVLLGNVAVGGGCQGGAGGILTEISVGPNATSHVEYPQPLVAHLTGNQCVLAEVNGTGAMRVTGVGFTQ